MNLTSVSVLLATLALGGCAQGVIAANGDYMRAIAASFKVGMKATDVQTSLKELNAFSDIYNACSEQFESQLTPCDKGHNLVTTTRLPHHDPNLGQVALCLLGINHLGRGAELIFIISRDRLVRHKREFGAGNITAAKSKPIIIGVGFPTTSALIGCVANRNALGNIKSTVRVTLAFPSIKNLDGECVACRQVDDDERR